MKKIFLIGRMVMLGLLSALGGVYRPATTTAPIAPPPPDLSFVKAKHKPPHNPRAGARSPYQRRFVKGKVCRHTFAALRQYAGFPFSNGAPSLYRPAVLNRAARRALAQG